MSLCHDSLSSKLLGDDCEVDIHESKPGVPWSRQAGPTWLGSSPGAATVSLRLTRGPGLWTTFAVVKEYLLMSAFKKAILFLCSLSVYAAF